MLFLSPEEIADHVMLYKLTSRAIIEFQTLTLEDMEVVNDSGVGDDLRTEYNLYDPTNPYVSVSLDSDPRHPHKVSLRVFQIIWRRLR